MNELKSRIQALSEKFFDEILEIRRHLHAHPELSFHEKQTSEYIQDRLTSFGIDFKTGFVETGIVGVIEGAQPGSKVVAIRAEMDALPIKEETEVPWKSALPGVMHACGHDIHMACLLGAARILKEIQDELNGTVLLVFQPGEELLPGGARLMMEQGALNQPKPDVVLGLHVQVDIPSGKVGFKPGKYMASNDEIYIEVHGQGGHAAMPHEVTDNVLIASHIIVALQQIVSRNTNISNPTVLSFGKMIAEGATNVIPDRVHLEGTFRTTDEKWRLEAHKKIKSIACNTARSMGGSCEIEIRQGYPVLENDWELTKQSSSLAKYYLGNDKVLDLDIRMTSEDFAFYSQHFPSCFYRLGVGGQAKSTGLHTSRFLPDEEAIQTGMGIMAFLAISHLNDAQS